MRPLVALIKREFAAYFLSPVAYVTMAVFLAVTGAAFGKVLSGLTTPGSAGIEYPFQAWLGDEKFWLVFLFIPPLLTMRLFAEERGTGTLETLLTAPIRDWQVVAGKYIGAMMFYTVLWLPTLVYLPIMADIHVGTWKEILGDERIILIFGSLLAIAVLFWTLIYTSSGWFKILAILAVEITVFATQAPGLIADFGGPRAVLILGIALVVVLVVMGICLLIGYLFGGGIDLGGALANLTFLLLAIVGIAMKLYFTRTYTGPRGFHAGIDPWPVLTSYLGVMLAGAMFLAIGLLVSSLVKSQLVAAMLAMVVGLVFVLAAFWRPDIDSGSLFNRLVYFVSVPEHFRKDFSRGILDTRPLILYLSVTCACLFLTVRSLEFRRLRA